MVKIEEKKVKRKPIGYWTDAKLKTEALKYKTRGEFKKNSKSAYGACVRKKILDMICVHMEKRQKSRDIPYIELKTEALKYNSRKEFKEKSPRLFFAANRRRVISDICKHMVNPNKKWTKEACKIEALKYCTKKELIKHSSGCYNVIRENKWQKELCSHMTSVEKPKRYWKNIGNLMDEAAKYKSKTEFIKNCNGAYKSANELGVLSFVCSHMVQLRKPNHYWTKDKVKIEANKYTNKTDFNTKSKVAYTVAHRDGYLEEVCSHMDSNVGDKYWRFVYECRDEKNKIIYVGLTHCIKERTEAHINHGHREDVTELVKKFGLNKVTPEAIYVTEAAQMEIDLIAHYRASTEWECINRTRGGEL